MEMLQWANVKGFHGSFLWRSQPTIAGSVPAPDLQTFHMLNVDGSYKRLSNVEELGFHEEEESFIQKLA